MKRDLNILKAYKKTVNMKHIIYKNKKIYTRKIKHKKFQLRDEI